MNFHIINHPLSCVMSGTVRLWFLTAETTFYYPVISCEIRGGQCGTGAGWTRAGKRNSRMKETS